MDILEIKKIDENSQEFPLVKKLYYLSFPKNERDHLKKLAQSDFNCANFISFFDKNKFVGFAYLLTHNKITHILYFAIDPLLRNNGYGKKALLSIEQMFKGNTLICDIELPEKQAKNNAERENRRAFYLHNDFHETDIKYRWNKIDYEILSFGQITDNEFDVFWKHFKGTDNMGKFLYSVFKHNTTYNDIKGK